MSSPDRKPSGRRPDPSTPCNRPDLDPPDLTAPTGATPEELRRLNRALSTRWVQLVTDLCTATAARDTAERQRTQISRTLIQQTHELRELERLHKDQGEELKRLPTEVSDLRSAGCDASGSHAQQVAGLQGQITQQTAEIQDLGRQIARFPQERDRVRDGCGRVPRGNAEVAADGARRYDGWSVTRVKGKAQSRNFSEPQRPPIVYVQRNHQAAASRATQEHMPPPTLVGSGLIPINPVPTRRINSVELGDVSSRPTSAGPKSARVLGNSEGVW
ncbi:hypothetical protein ON010_g6904 [Phytophthora cinnamomi]|nr:hypothetical protein ON010_g6904 [Phytophthora cinnamomi]